MEIREQLLSQVLDSAPPLVAVTYRGTRTILRKVNREDGSSYWTGSPMALDNGHQCRYGLVIERDGYIVGSAAVNFITNGGWKPGANRATGRQKSQIAGEFRHAFLHACMALKEVGEGTQTEQLVDHLQRQTGLHCFEGPMTEGDLETMALMGIPHDVTVVARSNGLTFHLDVPRFMARHVQPSYAECVPGEWGAESEEVAMTSSLTAGQVLLLRMDGMCLRKVGASRARG